MRDSLLSKSLCLGGVIRLESHLPTGVEAELQALTDDEITARIAE